jgi:hypothetical protein
MRGYGVRSVRGGERKRKETMYGGMVQNALSDSQILGNLGRNLRIAAVGLE